MSFPSLAEIKRRRKNLDLSQKQLADLCGIGQSFLAKIERGQVTPSYTAATRLFERLEHLESKNAEKLGLVVDRVASDIMTRQVCAFGLDDAAESVLKVMVEKDISQVPILDERGFQQGVVTEKTLLGKELKGKTVKEIMDKHVFPIVAANTKLSVIISIIKEEQAVLVSEKGMIGGIITKQDILKNTKQNH